MHDHTTIEKRLKTEIHYKNSLRRDFVDSFRQMHAWQEKLNVIQNKRKEKKLTRTIQRYQDFIDDLRSFLSPLLDELEEAIKEEMSFSEDEIKEFREEVKEEIKLASDARAAYKKAREASEEAEGKKLEPEELALLHDVYSKAWRAFRLEKHKLEDAEEELKSEEVDRKIFARELKRIHVERHFINEM
ncbi:MAG: hypothetical protein KAQ97_05890 [Candidatus Fermentibacteraceae bacterium]|nr:hypothetical protein [Candidatus Fermentibacteraceae bacterium]